MNNDRWLWFTDRPRPKRGAGALLYDDTCADGLRAAIVLDVNFRLPQYPDEVDRELYPMAAMAVANIGFSLDEVGVPLPHELHHWATARDVPAADIKPPTVTGMVIEGTVYLALCWRYDHLAVVVTVNEYDCVAVIVPFDSLAENPPTLQIAAWEIPPRWTLADADGNPPASP